MVDIKATFCHERCQKGPVVSIGGKMIEKATAQKVIEVLEHKLELVGANV
jgi:NADH:ubiquinone oxidoreductase subunit E